MIEHRGVEKLKQSISETVTIVTAFVDIGRDSWEGVVNGARIDGFIKRDVDTYFQRFERLTKLNNPIVCYIHSMYHQRIKSLRSDITVVAIDDILTTNREYLDRIEAIQTNPTFIKFVTRPSVPEYFSPGYVLVTSRKAQFCNHAITNGLTKTNTVAWIDFGYGRPETPIPIGLEWKFNTDDKINLVCNSKTPIMELPIFEIIRSGEVYIQGCHVIAPAHQWKYLETSFNNSLNSMLNIGVTDDDQTLFLMAYRDAPELFKIHYVDPNSFWFMIFRDFHHE